MRALVVGGRGARGALAACRGLAAEGWTVGVGSPGAGGLAARSRFVTRRHSIPPPEQDLDAFLHAVALAVTTGRYDVVFGAGDAEVLAMSAVRSQIEAVYPYPHHDVLLRAFDKMSLADAGRRAGLAVPATTPATKEALQAINQPVVVKARLHWDPRAVPARARLEAALAAEATDAELKAKEIEEHGGDPLLQRVIDGRLMALTALVDGRGRLIVSVQQSAERIWPLQTGISSRAITVPAEPALVDKVARLLEDLGWFGLAQLQFVHPRDGDPHLIDLNGRFYGSIALALAAGCNLPAAWANLALGHNPEAGNARVGVRYQWLEGDLRRALKERQGGVMADVAGSLIYALRSTHSIWSIRDPLPALTHGASLLGRAARKTNR